MILLTSRSKNFRQYTDLFLGFEKNRELYDHDGDDDRDDDEVMCAHFLLDNDF